MRARAWTPRLSEITASRGSRLGREILEPGEIHEHTDPIVPGELVGNAGDHLIVVLGGERAGDAKRRNVVGGGMALDHECS